MPEAKRIEQSAKSKRLTRNCGLRIAALEV